MNSYKKEFIEFMVDSQVLKFGEFTLKADENPLFYECRGICDGNPVKKAGRILCQGDP